MIKTLRKEKVSASQILTTFGVGAVLPLGQESFMVLGIDEWPDNPPKGTPLHHKVYEARLQKILGLHEFRTVPSTEKDEESQAIPVTRFPTMYVCGNASCRLIQKWNSTGICRQQHCDTSIAPSRFITVCEDGHIDEFPFKRWAHLDTGECPRKEQVLRLKSVEGSSSIDAIFVSCDCGASKSMKGTMGSSRLEKMKCLGKTPWLPFRKPDDCSKSLVGRQRTGGDVWYASTVSALSIPPWTSLEHQFVNEHWMNLRDEKDPASITKYLLQQQNISGRWGSLEAEGVLEALEARHAYLDAEADGDVSLRAEEYTALLTAGVAVEEDRKTAEQFRAYPQDVPPKYQHIITSVTKATRLREVRVFEGFHRLQPTKLDEDRTPAPISREKPTWLPAAEVLGEGIFLEFNEARITEWAVRPQVARRIAKLEESLKMASSQYASKLSAKYLLLHSLAHALNRELCMEAGYPSASIRERIYADDRQAGILLYTSSGDSAGSLGGLCAQAEPESLQRVIRRAVEVAQWCTSDPVCSESEGNGMHAGNLAACHACLLLPETSCECMNVLLDRQTLVGALDDESIGFF